MKHLSASLLVLLAVGPLVARADVPPPGDRPNIVVFFSDDQGYGDLGCYGSKDLRTPNIDRMAAEGLRFKSWYSAAPVCSPSRAALLTGRSPQGAGVPGNVSSYPGKPGMPPEQITIAERLKPLGYATAAVGKWHLGSAPGAAPNDQGFGRFFGFFAGCVDNFSHTFYWDAPHFHDLRRDDREVYEDGTYLADIVTREALRFVDENRDGPFFLYVAYNLPHYPLQAPQRILKKFAHLPPSRAKYAATLAVVDESVGDVLARLDEHKLADRTLVVFLSDHGATAEARGDGPVGDNGPFRGRKFSLFEGGLRVPSIIRRPGVVPAGQVRDQVACTFDLAPTFLAAAGGSAEPGAFEGKALTEVILRDAPSPHASLAWSSAGQDAVREGRWKLVRNGRDDQNRPLSGPDALFLADLEADPGETKNLAADHPEIVERFTKIHADWAKSVAGPR
ncbi:sulfatase family protein [Paludisphaera soli]|uniref:sulfatase family protein n=1 Tax=Paludisphaera soli TaxID=2712865 RepID=UPI0013EE1F8C|nr:sulfatase-like hydrolase/transferase [Paludisphaera soli]